MHDCTMARALTVRLMCCKVLLQRNCRKLSCKIRTKQSRCPCSDLIRNCKSWPNMESVYRRIVISKKPRTPVELERSVQFRSTPSQESHVMRISGLSESHMAVEHSPSMCLWSIVNNAVLQVQMTQIDQFWDAATRVTVALGEVPVIIVGDMQGNPAEQPGQMSIALRRGWLADEGWEHCSTQTGCPAPTFISESRDTHRFSSHESSCPRYVSQVQGG